MLHSNLNDQNRIFVESHHFFINCWTLSVLWNSISKFNQGIIAILMGYSNMLVVFMLTSYGCFKNKHYSCTLWSRFLLSTSFIYATSISFFKWPPNGIYCLFCQLVVFFLQISPWLDNFSHGWKKSKERDEP